ncbi:hypothetical protein B0G81_5000 [Paraburkholderia sp. BL6665CI2N2]|uniref:hypothetical protein n=1 Tax=Paraburkholderia sp. BL6665CI2N2 TaxID=1938806 RepID=UPI0010658A30|nr:hypothetical protein [Paraburkholderia sp. BL6665CI2N2]TDY24562.1 hypothetical protein B0G81_5000 [Paraburkholderia sp. BL6665CI2N2]
MATLDGIVDEVLDPAPLNGRKHNPALDYTPLWRSRFDALKQLTFDPVRRKSGLMESDGFPNFPTDDQVRLFYELVTNITHSRLERNPADPLFQSRLYDAASFIADSEDVHGRRFNSPVVSVPTSGARGIWVSIPAGHGEQAVVSAIQRCIGTSAHRFYADSPAGGRFDISIVKSLTVPFPATGSPRTFVDTFLKQMDTAVSDGSSTYRTGPFRRDNDEVANAMSSLAIQHNLGALLVPNLTRKAVKGEAGGVLLGMLARFTELSGIPVVCFATTAATTASDAHGKAVHALRRVPVSILALQLEDDQWFFLADYLWENYFRFRFSHPMPDWFLKELWRHTQGLIEPATKLAAYAYSIGEITRESELNESLLEAYAHSALELDVGMLTSLRFLANGLVQSRNLGFRSDYADSFPLQDNQMNAPLFYGETISTALELLESKP